VARDCQFPEQEIDLGGGTLYVFTDGITEARTEDGTQCGVTGLQGLIGEVASLPLSERLRAITAHVAEHPLRDDVTVLAIDGSRTHSTAVAPGERGSCGGRPLLTLQFPARADSLKTVRSTVQDVVADAGCDIPCTTDIVMAVDEACQNIIRHAYGGEPGGTILLEIEQKDDVLVFWLRDFAPKVDVDKVQPRDLEDIRPGGLGTHFIREAMDESGFVPCPSKGNIFRMAKRIR